MAETIPEIKQKLDDLGVDYPSSAKKADLEALLAEHTTDPEPEPSDPAGGGEPDPSEDDFVGHGRQTDYDPADVLKATPENAVEYISCPSCGHSGHESLFVRSYVAPDDPNV